jgi:uncharacterized membrane protein YjgN (DUF898 family)
MAGASARAAIATGSGHALRIRFTGSGSEYFRIWVVNQLLTLVTLGFYYPWAKARRLRYFYGNTLVGECGLDFHGDPRRMLRGFLLIGLLVLIYSTAGKVSSTAGLTAFVIVAAIWPALLRASMQFRLANTSWRGLRLRFTGDFAGAYRAVLPLFVPGFVLLAALRFGEGAAPGQRGAAGMVALLAVAVSLALLPWFWWLLKKYQHDHYALAQVRTELRAGVATFYWEFLKIAAVGVLVSLLLGVAGGVGFAAMRAGGNPRGAAFAALIGVIAFYLALFELLRPYATSRLQNLVWGRTKGSKVRFESDLRFRPLLGLTLKNWLLTLATIGLYWPFAAVTMARLRLEAVTVYTSIAPDELFAEERAAADDASGDAAGDLFGIDIGL